MSNTIVIIKNLRSCLNAQDLDKSFNKIVKFPSPTLKKIISKLKERKWYTVIGFSGWFQLVGPDDESSKLCIFNTSYGTCLKLSFDSNVAPAIS